MSEEMFLFSNKKGRKVKVEIYMDCFSRNWDWFFRDNVEHPIPEYLFL